MDQEGLLAPAIGVEERSDETPSAGASAVAEPLDSEVVLQPTRRRSDLADSVSANPRIDKSVNAVPQPTPHHERSALTPFGRRREPR